VTTHHGDGTPLVGVVGAGAMGTGIAQVAAAAGDRVIIADATPKATEKARASISKSLDREVEKQRLSRADADAILSRIDFQEEALHGDAGVYHNCDLVIEAVVERIDVKQSLFKALEQTLSAEAILATNTSSLSVAAIASSCATPARIVGMHFFNPAPLMPLVEVVPWLASDPDVVRRTFDTARRWKKQPVVASDTPGFIVNRVARPFYGEALRLYDEGVADCATIDWAMKELGGFRMGPFELMDFIGNDVNYAVTRTVFESLFHDPRYKPSLTQQRLVDAGFLGRKSGRGYYDYRDGASRPEPNKGQALGRLIFERILAMLINEAVDAVLMRVASPEDIDLAMTKGVNYPKGLLAWANELGLPRVLGWLEGLHAEYGEDRYRPSALLRRMVRDERRFFQ
jgi:3-hydroxybutyryl-CoA dehydrogenase